MALEFISSTRRAAVLAGTGLVFACLVEGCHSAYVAADLRNDSGATISLTELDYPSASFGTESLAAGGVYHYRFKILGSGPTKVLWTDAAHQEHSVAGPQLREGQEGTLTVTIAANSAAWTMNLHP